MYKKVRWREKHMPIELITENHGEEIKEILSLTKDTIKIISPFMARITCEELARNISRNNIKCQIITRFYREDFIQNVSDLDGLLRLLEAGAEIRALVGLHAKLYIFDNIYSIITSANYTYKGFYTNFELGIKLEEEIEILLKCEEYFNNLWNQIEEYNLRNNNKAIITKELIENERKIINIGSASRTSSTVNSNNVKQGAELDINPSQDIDLIEIALNRSLYNQVNRNDFAGWLKFTSGAKSRHDPEQEFLVGDNTFTKNKTFFPRPPRGIKADKKLFLASVSYDIDNIATPIIMGRCDTFGYNENNVIKNKFSEWMDWMIEYPYYIICKNLEIIKGPVKNGISLLDVYRKLHGDIYPSQIGSDITFENIRKFHYQKDKIKITNKAVDYLNKELDKKFIQFGKEYIE
jgi:hypothetical protein